MSKEKTNNSFVRFIRANLSMLVALAFVSIFFSIASPTFLTKTNLLNVLRQISMNAIIAFGMTFVLLTGGIDLSVGSVMAMVNCFSIGMMVDGVPIGAAIASGVLMGAIVGLVNGLIIAKAKIPAFITTLAMMTIARGTAYVYTGGKPVRFDNDMLSWFGNGYVGAVPVPVIVMFICFAILFFVLHKIRFGTRVFAVGGNREAAVFSGIKVDKIEVIVYTICGLLAGLAGMIMSARMLSAQPTSGEGAEINAISAVVLGGTSMNGGIGSMAGTLIGALFIGILNNGLNIIGVSSYWQEIIKGIVILIAVFFDVIKNKKLKS